MKIGDATTGSAPPPPVARAELAVRASPVASTSAADDLHQARLSAVVALIESLTGREVKLVPPAAYFVSRPAPPLESPVDLVIRADLATTRTPSAAQALEIGVHSILRTGTTPRMVLGASDQGGLHLTAAVAVDL